MASWCESFFRTADSNGRRREGSSWRCWGIEHKRRSFVVYLVAGPRLTEFDSLRCARRFCEAIDGLADWSRPWTEIVADKELGRALHQAALRITGGVEPVT
jgi:hypothetical protein